MLFRCFSLDSNPWPTHATGLPPAEPSAAKDAALTCSPRHYQHQSCAIITCEGPCLLEQRLLLQDRDHIQFNQAPHGLFSAMFCRRSASRDTSGRFIPDMSTCKNAKVLSKPMTAIQTHSMNPDIEPCHSSKNRF